MSPVSVGRLLAMTATNRAETIRDLHPTARRKLAHLAALGAREASTRAAQFLDSGRHEQWVREQITAARERADIAAELTTDTHECGDHPAPCNHDPAHEKE